MALFCPPYQCACFTPLLLFGLLVLRLALFSINFYVYLHLKQGCHIQNDYSGQKKGHKLEWKMPQKEFTLKIRFFIQQFCLWGNKSDTVFCVFSDWMWPCSSFQCSWACIHVGRLWLRYNVCHFLLSFLHFVFVSRSSSVSLLLCLPS